MTHPHPQSYILTRSELTQKLRNKEGVMMVGCEKCWDDSNGDATVYEALLLTRARNPCTVFEQCGDIHVQLDWKDSRTRQCRCGRQVGSQRVQTQNPR